MIFEKIREERGELNLIQVCTFGTETLKSAINSGCRGYRSKEYPDGLPIETAQYLSSLIPKERGFLPPLKDVLYGNEEKGTKPIKSFINEIEKYPGLLEILEAIEGLKNKRGQHASGVVLYNKTPFETNALMRSPNGDLTTQYDLHTSEKLGDVKYDFLVTEVCDKITICIEQLIKYGYLNKDKSLREIYNEVLNPENIDLSEEKIWNKIADGSIMDLFQFSTDVGLSAAKVIKPKSPNELVSANALMRLAGEKGKERPLERYCRLKNDMNQWYKELKEWNLTDEEIKIIEPYYLPNYGVPALQEDLMEVCMDKNISHFTLTEGNMARKVVAKKIIKEVPKLKEKFVSQCPNRNFGEYIWETVMLPQMSYSFSRPHSLAYSFIAIQTVLLATHFPEVFWNCACLIVNAGGAELLNASNEESEDKKNKTVNYGKISTAIANCKQHNIIVKPPNINTSELIFSPSAETNSIFYGIKGLNRIGDQLIYDIIKNRPYTSIDDFLSKVKVNVVQMISLIKSGAFDCICDNNREKAMDNYINSICGKKLVINLRNMNMLIEMNLIPKEYDFYRKLYNYNNYLKTLSKGNNFILNKRAIDFYLANFDEEFLVDLVLNGENSSAALDKKTWKKIYDKKMLVFKNYLKENQDEILAAVNTELYNSYHDKYAKGNISKWEMDSVGFYFHPHELQNLQNDRYNISNFFNLTEQPEVDSKWTTKNGKEITTYKLSRIAGTIIDKNKDKSTITVLTVDGVVKVKIWKNQFPIWDRRIISIDQKGNKHILEESWFTRGNKIIITGIRREDVFVPKVYKKTPYPLFQRIDKLNDDGEILESAVERIESEI